MILVMFTSFFKKENKIMVNNKLENYIAAQFNKISDDKGVFPGHLDPLDWQMVAIKKIVGNFHNLRVLDAGCGNGKFIHEFDALGAQSYGFDISTKLVKEAQKNFGTTRVVRGSLTNIPFRDNYFDILICVEVLEHIPDTTKAIAEMCRVLKKSGIAIIIDKNIIGLHPVYCYPIYCRKKYLESRGKWMYPKDSRFNEIWFTAHGLKKKLSAKFSDVSVTYLEREKTIINYPRKLTPWLSSDILWKATK